ncbi:hypothetical protein QBC39DRAFT_340093 [Podospora conica]|nr:hypothetical protein QBC39DRAFT_340093 [Schizothecium conicum]
MLGNEGEGKLVFHVIADAPSPIAGARTSSPSVPTVACQDLLRTFSGCDSRGRDSGKKVSELQGLAFVHPALSSPGIDCDAAHHITASSTSPLRYSPQANNRTGLIANSTHRRPEAMSAGSMLARAILPPRRLPTRPPPHFLPVLCCGPTPFRRTPALLFDKFDKVFDRDKVVVRRVPMREPKSVRTGKLDLDLESSSKAEDAAPRVVDWGSLGSLSGQPEETPAMRKESPWQIKTRNRLEKKAQKGVLDKAAVPLWKKEKRAAKSVLRLTKKQETRTKTLQKMNQEMAQYKAAKSGITPGEEPPYEEDEEDEEGTPAGHIEPANDAYWNSRPFHTDASEYQAELLKIQAELNVAPGSGEHQEEIDAHMRRWQDDMLNRHLQFRARWENALRKIKAELKVHPRSGLRQDEIDAHMAAWEEKAVRRANAKKVPREIRRYKQLYEKELAKFQAKLGVTPGSGEHQEEIDSHMRKWEEKRKKLEATMKERAEKRKEVAKYQRLSKKKRKQKEREEKEGDQAGGSREWKREWKTDTL